MQISSFCASVTASMTPPRSQTARRTRALHSARPLRDFWETPEGLPPLQKCGPTRSSQRTSRSDEANEPRMTPPAQLS
jgi:hypothetical protein